jgi:hypothetical protein
MWDPQHLTALWAFTACYGDSFTFIYDMSFLQMFLPELYTHFTAMRARRSSSGSRLDLIIVTIIVGNCRQVNGTSSSEFTDAYSSVRPEVESASTS